MSYPYWPNLAASWHSCNQPMALSGSYGRPDFLGACRHLFFVLEFGDPHFPLDNTPYILVSTVMTWVWKQVLVLLTVSTRSQVLLELEICISIQILTSRNHEVLKNILVDCCSDLGFKKGSNTQDLGSNTLCIGPQILTDCGYFSPHLKQLGLHSSCDILQTLGPWFSNERHTLLSSDKGI